jgi:ribosomal protein L19
MIMFQNKSRPLGWQPARPRGANNKYKSFLLHHQLRLTRRPRWLRQPLLTQRQFALGQANSVCLGAERLDRLHLRLHPVASLPQIDQVEDAEIGCSLRLGQAKRRSGFIELTNSQTKTPLGTFGFGSGGREPKQNQKQQPNQKPPRLARGTLYTVHVVLYSSKKKSGLDPRSKNNREESATPPQTLQGICIKKKNRGINSLFTLRSANSLNNESITQTFPLYSPFIKKIEISSTSSRFRVQP